VPPEAGGSGSVLRVDETKRLRMLDDGGVVDAQGGDMRSDVEGRLVCVECGVESDEDARSWRTYLTLEADGSAEAWSYCPRRAQAEFDA
jgi:hypothetical protein